MNRMSNYLDPDAQCFIVGSPAHQEYLREEKLKKERAEQERIAARQMAIEREGQEQAAIERVPYSDLIATEICERIASGELLTVVCNDPHMPTARSVTKWLKQHSDFNALYNMALQDRLTTFEEQIIEFGDDKSKDVQRATVSSTKEKVQFTDPVQRAKLQIEVRMKHLRAGRPAKWEDVSTLITKSDDPNDVSNLSEEELERRIAEIEEKDKYMKRSRTA